MGLKRRYVRASGWIGVLNPLIVSTLVLSAISISPWFSWTENALSDLGVSGSAAPLFNTALIVGGTLLIIFAIGLWKILQGRLTQIGILLLLLDGTALSAIGIFPETAGQIHFYVSLAFFMLLTLSILFLGLAHILEIHNTILGILGVLLSLLSISIWFFPWQGIAIPEAAAYLSGATWWIMISSRSITSSS